jgi:capsular polysaccharide biosynthesis protein
LRHSARKGLAAHTFAPALPMHSMLFWFAVSFGLAVPASIGAGFTAEYFDPTIRTPDEADDLLEAPVLAWLPQEQKAGSGSVVLHITRPKGVLS